jgi:hypothetical protein
VLLIPLSSLVAPIRSGVSMDITAGWSLLVTGLVVAFLGSFSLKLALKDQQRRGSLLHV